VSFADNGDGTGTITFSNPGTIPGEYDLQVSLSDDNWGEDPVGELQSSSFTLSATLYAQATITEDSFVDPVLMDPFNMYETDTYIVYLSTHMPADIRDQVDFAITVNGGSRSFVKLSGDNIEITPDLGDAGSYTVAITITDAPGSDIGEVSMNTEFTFTVEAQPEEESLEEQLESQLSLASDAVFKELSEVEISEDAPKQPPTAKSNQVQYDGTF